MRVLVTGGTGFLGAHCVEAIVAAGHSVRLLVRSPAKVDALFGPLGVRIDEVMPGDMADARSVAVALAGCDAVLHAAATMYGGEDVYAANLAGVRNVVCGAIDRGLDPVIYISSVGAMFPPPGPVATVDDPIGDLATVYGRSKAEGERIARDRQTRGAAITTLYPGGIYGPRDPGLGEATRGLRDAIRFGWPITRGGGVSIVDVRDIADLVVRCLEPGWGPRRFMAGGHFVTWAEFAAHCERLTGRPMRRIPTPAGLVRFAGRALDLVRKIRPIDFPLTHEAALFLTQLTPCDSEPTCRALDFRFRSTDETLTDAIRWLAEIGQLEAGRAGRLAAR
jgi:dihydroflavonol-4-reductase